MNREAWFVFFGMVVVAVLSATGYVAWQKHRQLEIVRTQLSDLRRDGEAHAARLAEAWKEVEMTRDREEALAEQMARAASSQKRLESELRSVLESRDVAVSDLQGRLTVTILDRILFDSGDATLKPEGMRVLDEVAQVLARYTNRPVQVFGHTDNVPIRLRFPSNWELSMARALAAVRYLTEKAGVDPRRLSAVGCGEHQPIADNATPEGRARNRRIALVVLPDLFVPTDVVPDEPGEPGEPAVPDAFPEDVPVHSPAGASGRLPDDGDSVEPVAPSTPAKSPAPMPAPGAVSPPPEAQPLADPPPRDPGLFDGPVEVTPEEDTPVPGTPQDPGQRRD
ncbi:MAG: OmpA family protein [Verrucomicrobiae bacterium]|nr:OmpA family protein [Verrucomicrobiae bacterium]